MSEESKQILSEWDRHTFWLQKSISTLSKLSDIIKDNKDVPTQLDITQEFTTLQNLISTDLKSTADPTDQKEISNINTNIDKILQLLKSTSPIFNNPTYADIVGETAGQVA